VQARGRFNKEKVGALPRRGTHCEAAVRGERGQQLEDKDRVGVCQRVREHESRLLVRGRGRRWPVPALWLEAEDARNMFEERSGHARGPGRRMLGHREASLAQGSSWGSSLTLCVVGHNLEREWRVRRRRALDGVDTTG
jgi:hypothetical protein